MRERILDLTFLLGVLFKGLDGLAELFGAITLLVLSPGQLLDAAQRLTAEELTEDPDDLIANLLLHALEQLGAGTSAFLAVYLLLHGVVKLAIVAALLLGTRRLYPWAIAALGLFLLYQLYALLLSPDMWLFLLTLFDAIIIGLTWREWRHGRPIQQTWHSTLSWLLRRDQRAD